MEPVRSESRALVWFRRDLRAEDHAALHRALARHDRVWCAFVFDRAILDPLPRPDRRVAFIHACVAALHQELAALGARHGRAGTGLIVRHGHAGQEIPALAAALRVQAVYLNHDDDPYALARDAQVRGALAGIGIALHGSKDHVVFERSEVLTASGTPYGVYTPYSRNWLARLDAAALAAHPVEPLAAQLAPLPAGEPPTWPTLEGLDFGGSTWDAAAMPAGSEGGDSLLTDFLVRMPHYAERRDFPAVRGPSYLSPHLRFGTLSIRRLVRLAHERAEQGSAGARAWRNELIWREFFHQVLHHHPHVVGHAFRPAFERLRWNQGAAADAHFAAWCEGRTGYPLVDAAQRQLLASGWMHNRLRMVSASFLVKHLGIDWRRGEAWFARHLLDFDLAANNGGWQWAASTGCDAQPWFRIFNPITQSQRYDADGRFIRRYVPELARLPAAAVHAPWLARPADLAAAGIVLGRDYPAPLVDHAHARQAALARYAAVTESRGAAARA